MASKAPLLRGKQVDGITPFKKWVFGTGHLLNDIVGATWFNYGLFYMANVQGISTATAGIVFLVGQIVDASATPIVGYLSDKCTTRIGKRMPWYIFGTLLVPLSFLFVFLPCYPLSLIHI